MLTKHLQILLISLITLIGTFTANAQQFTLQGRLTNGGRAVSQSLGIRLLEHDSNAVVTTAVSDSSGRFSLTKLSRGQYNLEVRSIEYMPFTIAVVMDRNKNLGNLALIIQENSLSEVSVNVVRPSVIQKADRTIIDVAASINNAGSTVMEVLEKSPGIVVDANGGIKLRGKSGVLVMIDGKVQPLSGDDLIAFLKGMSSDQVDKIDLISTPPAKYDASGNAGIIDIKIKRERRGGTNGAVNANFGQDRYSRTGAGFNLGHLHKKLSLNAAYNYTYRTDFQDLDIQRVFSATQNNYAYFESQNRMKMHVGLHNAQLSADYAISEKSTLGAAGSIYRNDNVWLFDSNGLNLNASKGVESTLNANNRSEYHRFNPSGNLNYKYARPNGVTITADLDYALFTTASAQDNKSISAFTYGPVPPGIYLQTGSLDGHLTIASAKADYSAPIKGWLDKVEMGLKSAQIDSRNIIDYFNVTSGIPVREDNSSNDFSYRENVTSAYSSSGHKGKGFGLQLGIRAEHTRTETLQKMGNISNTRSYIQLFPSATLEFELSKRHQLGFSYSKRIDRPSYRQLNPFRWYINRNTYTVGNPGLRPQITHAIDLTHTISGRFTMRYSFKRTLDNMVPFIYQDAEVPGTLAKADRNLDHNDFYGIDVSIPIDAVSWLKSYNNVILYHSYFNGILDGVDFKASQSSFKLNSTNNFIISPTFSMELTANYTSRERDGVFYYLPFWSIGTGLQKTFFSKKAVLRLNLSDVFYTANSGGTGVNEQFIETFQSYQNTRRVTLSLNYRFGKPAQQQKKKAGAEDEKRRAG